MDYSMLRGRIREVLGSEREFAAAIGISRTQCSLTLNGRRNFKVSEIIKACNILGISNSELGVYFFTPKV